MATLRFGPEDRDERGFVRVPEPRSLADLLPTPAQIQSSAQSTPQIAPRTYLVAAGVLILVAIGLMAVLFDRAPLDRRTNTTHAGSAAVSTPTAQPTPAMIAAYWAPNGERAPDIRADTKMTPIGRFGEDWIWEQIPGSKVWLPMEGFDRTPTFYALHDYQPVPTATARPYVPPVPAPTDPPQCARVGTAGDMAEACGYAALDDLQATAQAAWIQQNGMHPAIVTTPTPYSYK